MDENVAVLENLFREAKGPLVQAMDWANPFMSQIKRGGPEAFEGGTKIRVPMILAPHQGAGGGDESSILNAPERMATAYAQIQTAILHITVGVTTLAELAARGKDASWLTDLMQTKMEMAREGYERVLCEMMAGDGTALIAAITGSSSSTTITVGTTANWYWLYPERIADILVRSSGATVLQRVKITDTDEAAGTVTVDQAVTVDSTMGFYIQGSYGKAIQGILGATAATGTFQNMSKTTYPIWKGTKVSPSNAQDLTMALLDKLEYQQGRRTNKTGDWLMGDPACIDLYAQNVGLQSEWSGDTAILRTGWQGVRYRNKAIIRDYNFSRRVVSVREEDVTIYQREAPDWDELGGMFKRFSRSLPFEAWYVGHIQMGFHRCVTQGEIDNLNGAYDA